MALPSRPQTFAYESCRDLLEKLRRELDRYRAVEGREDADVQELQDIAFNASVTAWQLGDWVFNDLTPEQREKLGFHTKAELQEHAKANCRALYLCRHVATASKHWEVSQYPDDTVDAIVTGETGWTIYFVDDGTKIPADQVFEQALGFWSPFIYQNEVATRPMTRLRRSRGHGKS